MANYMKKNLELLRKNNPVFSAMEQLIENIPVPEDAIINKDGILYFKYEDKYYRLHSENKLEEAAYMMREVEETKDHLLLVFGMGNIELLWSLYRNTSDGTRIALFEPNIYVLKYVMSHYDLTELIGSNKFAFIVGDKETVDRGIVLYMEQKWDNLAKNVVVIKHPNYHVYNEICLECVQRVTEKIDKMLKSLGTDLEDMLDGLSNNYKNVDACLTCNSIEEIEGKYKGYPAIIVASGPSLDKNIDLLKEAQGKALIITCDASYTACKNHGVTPDMIASIERYYPTYQFFYEGKEFEEDLVLVGPTLMWPAIYEKFPKRKILMSKNYQGVDEWWASHFDKIKFVNQGMSCANVAYGVAKKAGCDPIILIGQDLAYTGEKIHSDQAHTKFEGKNQAGIEPGISDIYVEDINGDMVRTNIYYDLFRAYFEEQQLVKSVHLIDATEGGAKIRGSEIMTFREAIDRYCIKEIPFRLVDFLEEQHFDPEKAADKYNELIESADNMLSELKKVQDMVSAHYEVLMKYKDFDFEKADMDTLYNAVIDMEGANPIITYVVEENKNLVSYFQQIIKPTVIFVKKIGNELTGKNVKRNWELQVNFMHLMDIATVATAERFYEMRNFMQEKLKNVAKTAGNDINVAENDTKAAESESGAAGIDTKTAESESGAVGIDTNTSEKEGEKNI